jgi:hypothetical protein
LGPVKTGLPRAALFPHLSHYGSKKSIFPNNASYLPSRFDRFPEIESGLAARLSVTVQDSADMGGEETANPAAFPGKVPPASHKIGQSKLRAGFRHNLVTVNRTRENLALSSEKTFE